MRELKGNTTTFEVKVYFFRQLTWVRIGLYALTINKERLYAELHKQKERLYNYLARLILVAGVRPPSPVTFLGPVP